MSTEPENLELIPLNAIRNETVLSRFPVHRLAKKGSINIDIREVSQVGEIQTKWEVSYNSKYGQPGPLAYKVDTLIINRRIDETPKPLPKIIKLGSLRDICRELGLNEGQATRNVKQALLQNASAFITAKRKYKGNDGNERTAEISDTRYGVIFTGEKFPEGGRADAVYIMLHDAYRDVLNAAPTRPLNYDYLKELSPSAQRFYELLSFQIFAALKNQRPRAKMLYSYYCTRAPQTRYYEYDRMKKQMYKVHAPHKNSGYIAAVEFKETVTDEGQLDWEMFYTPGRRAKAEYREIMRRPHLAEQQSPLPLKETPKVSTKPAKKSESFASDEIKLIEQLRGLGVAESEAKELVRNHREATEEQLAAYVFRPDGEGKKNPAGWLVAAIRNRYELPQPYLEEKARADEVKRSQAKRAAIEACKLCNEGGFRIIKSKEYPIGAAKKCTHDPKIESKYLDAV